MSSLHFDFVDSRREVSLATSNAASKPKPEPGVMIMTNVSDEQSLLLFSVFGFDPMYLVCLLHIIMFIKFGDGLCNSEFFLTNVTDVI